MPLYTFSSLSKNFMSCSFADVVTAFLSLILMFLEILACELMMCSCVLMKCVLWEGGGLSGTSRAMCRFTVWLWNVPGLRLYMNHS